MFNPNNSQLNSSQTSGFQGLSQSQVQNQGNLTSQNQASFSFNNNNQQFQQQAYPIRQQQVQNFQQNLAQSYQQPQNGFNQPQPQPYNANNNYNPFANNNAPNSYGFGYGYGYNGASSYQINANYGDDEPILNDQQMAKTIGNGETPSHTEVDNAIKLSLRLKKSTLRSSSFADQTLPMLVSLAVDNLKSSTKAPLDLVCVLDNSGSMQGEKIQLVKNTFNYLLEYLGDSDRLSIIQFNSSATRLLPLMRTTQTNKQKILSTVNSIYACGGTNIDLGMQHAIQVLKQRKHFNSVSSIFLLSDGLDGGAQFRVSNSLKNSELSESVTINTFGFGNDHDPQLMNDIAALRDGNFYFINKLDTIDEAFIDCLGGALSSIAQNISITIKPEQSEVLKGVQIVKAYGDANMWANNQLANTYTTKMATLISGKQKDYVLELKVPTQGNQLQDHQKSIKVASAIAEMISLTGEKITKNAELVITLLNEDKELMDEEDDVEVMKNFYRVKGALLLTEARELADQRRNEEAKKLLEEFKTILQNSSMKNVEFIVNLIKDIDTAIHSVNPVVYQNHGRHDMFQNARAQMWQQSNLTSANCYQNMSQAGMIHEVRQKKGMFG